MSTNSSLNEFISFANTIADQSAEIIMQYFRSRFTIETKKDSTPVTIADKKCEEKIRTLISKHFYKTG